MRGVEPCALPYWASVMMCLIQLPVSYNTKSLAAMSLAAMARR